jgi:hypothetical protein
LKTTLSARGSDIAYLTGFYTAIPERVGVLL